jgi:protein-L-isoaspartate O-methyltransferase
MEGPPVGEAHHPAAVLGPDGELTAGRAVVGAQPQTAALLPRQPAVARRERRRSREAARAERRVAHVPLDGPRAGEEGVRFERSVHGHSVGVSRRRAAPEVVAAAGDLTVLRDPRRPSGRLLMQGDMEASYVDLADPGHLEFDYLRRMRDLVEGTGARRVLHVGGAGCALARALAAAHPEDRQEVVEVDPAVLALAREHLGLRRAPGLRVRTGDGRAVLAGCPDGSVDAVLVDAFVGARVPRHLVTAEALADVARVLGPHGVAAVNVVDVRPLAEAAAVLAGLSGAFAHVTVIAPRPVLSRGRGGNVVLVGAHAPLPLARLRASAAADPSPAGVLGTHELARFAHGAEPWRDADAVPVRG